MTEANRTHLCNSHFSVAAGGGDTLQFPCDHIAARQSGQNIVGGFDSFD